MEILTWALICFGAYVTSVALDRALNGRGTA